MLMFAVPAQDKLSNDDPRNFAPTVGTGGTPGGPTGLFTIYDGKTLRRGEYTFSLALSNYDRDPGNVDISDVPGSFQIGLTNRLELFLNSNLYRGIKVNAPGNLSSFFLPNAMFFNQAAIVLAPEGPGANAFRGLSVFRPSGMPFAPYFFTGSSAGNYQMPGGSGTTFGFAGGNATLGPPRPGGVDGAWLFPGVGSAFGSILPGLALSTTVVTRQQRPVTFTTAPSYLPDAPFVARTWGTSSFDSIDVGVKWRFNHSTAPVGAGLVLYYSWYPDKASSAGDFNMLQRGAGPGAKRGDMGAVFFVDGRLASWLNLSANAGYKYTSDPRGAGPGAVLLKRGDEFSWGVAADFPINRHIQPIAEFRQLLYIGSRTPNAFENNPMDVLAGVRFFPARWWGLSFAYRMHVNQQNNFDVASTSTVNITNCLNAAGALVPCVPQTITTTSAGIPQGFLPSEDPHGYIVQFFIGRREPRGGPVPNLPANVNAVNVSDAVISLPCPPGFRSRAGACNDSSTISVQTSASDPENDVLTYNYTVSGGRVVGTGANVQWDLSGAAAGTYTITAGVDDGCGVCGKTQTQTVKVEGCTDCVQICECGTLSVSGPGVVPPGSSMTFTANNTSPGSVTYNWSVSAGTISSGQGTASITVDTTGLAPNSNVTATVDLGGLDAACQCPSNASETGSIANLVPSLVDEFGPAKDDDVKARVDNFYITLNNNPNAQGYIINYGTPAEIKKRRAQIMKAINFRKYDVSRVTFVDGPDNGTGVNTKFYLVPAGATPPTP